MKVTGPTMQATGGGGKQAVGPVYGGDGQTPAPHAPEHCARAVADGTRAQESTMKRIGMFLTADLPISLRGERQRPVRLAAHPALSELDHRACAATGGCAARDLVVAAGGRVELRAGRAAGAGRR